jgi:putative flippase GtrA
MVDLCTLYVCIGLDICIYGAISVAFFIGLITNLWLHVCITFKTKFKIENSIKFLLIVGMNYGITLAMVFITQQMWQIYLLGKIASLPLVAINGFLWSKYWVFRQ